MSNYPKYYSCHNLFYRLESATTYTVVSLYRSSIGVRVVNVEVFDMDLMDESSEIEFNHVAAQALQLLRERIFGR